MREILDATLATLKQRRLVNSQSQFCREFLRCCPSYAAALRSTDREPTAKAMLRLHKALTDRGQHDLASRVYLALHEIIDAASSGDVRMPNNNEAGRP